MTVCQGLRCASRDLSRDRHVLVALLRFGLVFTDITTEYFANPELHWNPVTTGGICKHTRLTGPCTRKLALDQTFFVFASARWSSPCTPCSPPLREAQVLRRSTAAMCRLAPLTADWRRPQANRSQSMHGAEVHLLPKIR